LAQAPDGDRHIASGRLSSTGWLDRRWEATTFVEQRFVACLSPQIGAFRILGEYAVEREKYCANVRRGGQHVDDMPEARRLGRQPVSDVSIGQPGSRAMGAALQGGPIASPLQVWALQRLAGNAGVVSILQRIPQAGTKGLASIGTLAIEGLPPVAVLDATLDAKRKIIRDNVGDTRDIWLEPGAVETSDLVFTRRPDAGSDAYRKWFETEARDGTGRTDGRAGTLTLTKAGTGSKTLDAGTVTFTDAVPISFSTGDPEKWRIAIRGFSMRSANGDSAGQAPGIVATLVFNDPALGTVRVLAFEGGAARAEVVDERLGRGSRIKSTSWPQYEPVRVTLPLGPAAATLSDALSSDRRFDFSAEGGGRVVHYYHALVSAVDVRPGPNPKVEIEFTPEYRR
jgi:hypothetical protein